MTLVVRDYWPTNGWRTANPADQGIDPASPVELDRQIAVGYPHVRSVLIVRHGYLVYEHYRKGLGASSGHDVQDVTKTVIGALFGIAVRDGTIALDQTAGELLARHMPNNIDPRMGRVTVQQLLTMTAGLAANDANSTGDPLSSRPMVRSADWVQQILGDPLQANPGQRFAYSDAGAHLLSAILTDASGESNVDFRQ